MEWLLQHENISLLGYADSCDGWGYVFMYHDRHQQWWLTNYMWLDVNNLTKRFHECLLLTTFYLLYIVHVFKHLFFNDAVCANKSFLIIKLYLVQKNMCESLIQIMNFLLQYCWIVMVVLIISFCNKYFKTIICVLQTV